NSRTSQICFMVGVMIILAHKIPFLRKSPHRVVILSLIAAPMFYVGDTLFGISNQLLTQIGRDPTFTDRTEIWEAIKQQPVDPMRGLGYMMYWDFYGGVDLNHETVVYRTAHNGYLDTYLDGGVLGVLFLAVMLLAVGVRATREFLTGSEYG